MTDRSSSYNHHALSPSRRASPAWSQQPEAKCGPEARTDFKGLPVRPGSPREASCSSASQSLSTAAGQGMPHATPLHERQAEALTGLGGGKRKAEEPLTPMEDSKKARAATESSSWSMSATLDSVEDCLRELNRSKDSQYLTDQAAIRVAQRLAGTGMDAAARERFLSFVRSCPLGSVEDCYAVLRVVMGSKDRSVSEAAGREVGSRLGGAAIDALARDRLFEACLRVVNGNKSKVLPFFMAGVVSACLPSGFTRERADEWLGHFRKATNGPDALGFGRTWFEISEGREALAMMAAACGLTAREIAAYLIREHDHVYPWAGGENFFLCVVDPVRQAFERLGKQAEDYWPALLLAWAQEEEQPDWGDLTRTEADFDPIPDEAVPVIRAWALDRIQTQSAVAQKMGALLLVLEKSEASGTLWNLHRPRACEALRARLSSDPARAQQIPGVLLAVLCDFRFDFGDEEWSPEAWRHALRAFVLAAAPHATPSQWVAIGMEDRWFCMDGDGATVRQGFAPLVTEVHDTVKSSPEVASWLRLGMLCATPSPPYDLIEFNGLDEREKVRLMCRVVDHYDFNAAQVSRWLEMAANLPSEFDQTRLMAHVFETSEPEVLAYKNFRFARRQIVGNMMEQGAIDEGALKALKDAIRKALKDSKDTPKIQASVETHGALVVSRQIELYEDAMEAVKKDLKKNLEAVKDTKRTPRTPRTPRAPKAVRPSSIPRRPRR